MRVLVACELSGIVRDAFIANGDDAVSVDLEPTWKPGPHIQGNVLDVLNDGWDLMIAHPPCTYLASSGMHRTVNGERDPVLTEQAIAFVEALWAAPIYRIAIENPVGVLSTYFRQPTQIIQPYSFGENASKKTCLWLKKLPHLRSTKYVPPSRFVDGKPRWANQTASGQSNIYGHQDRSFLRSLTYPGIAAAMAAQWGSPRNAFL